MDRGGLKSAESGLRLRTKERGAVWRLHFPLALFPPHLSRGSTTRMRRFRSERARNFYIFPFTVSD
jgi:hypothetical protein